MTFLARIFEQIGKRAGKPSSRKYVTANSTPQRAPNS